MKLLLALLLLPSIARAYTPIPVVSTETTNIVLMELAQEIGRRDLTNGGTIHARVVISSDTEINGPLTTSGLNTYNGDSIFNGDVTFNGSVTGLGNDVSSYTYITRGTAVTQTTFLACQSTVTLTVAAVPLEVSFSGSMTSAGASQNICWGYMVDGEFTGLHTSAIGVVCAVGANSQPNAMSGSDKIAALSAGSHSFCFSMLNKAGAGAIAGPSGSFTIPQFGVRELH